MGNDCEYGKGEGRGAGSGEEVYGVVIEQAAPLERRAEQAVEEEPKHTACQAHQEQLSFAVEERLRAHFRHNRSCDNPS